MKFRIKFGNQNLVISVSNSAGHIACLEDLKKEIIQKISLTQFEISLNGKDPLVGDTVSLQDHGLVSGDRIYILEGDFPKTASTSCSREVNPEPEKSTSDSGTQPSTSDSTAEVQSSDPSYTGAREVTSNNAEMSTEVPKTGSSDTEESSHKDSTVNVNMETDPEVNRYLRLPMLIRESTENVVPEVLEVLYRDTRVQDIHGALFLVLHRLMIETGFKVKDMPDREEGLPSDWKKKGFCSVKYTSHSATDACVALKYVDLADVAKVHCSVAGSGVRCSCQLKVKDFVRTVTQDACSTYTNLHKLSMMFKDKVSFPILQSLHRDSVPSLLNLTTEVQLMVLSCLRPPDLLRVGAVCKQFQTLSSEPMLWRKLYLKNFGKRPDSNSLTQDWQKFYREKFEERARLREQYTLMTQPNYPDIPFHLGPDPLNQVIPPGAIGGDFDRDPFFQGVQGIFGRGRGGAAPPNFPRPRFDPMGPFPEQNFRPGRGGGLWEGSRSNRGGRGHPGGFWPRFM